MLLKQAYNKLDSWNRLRIFEAIRSTKTILIEESLLLNKYDEKHHGCISLL